ncbi:gluconeogenesis factor YvcK family protein [Tumidithrix elongata RA019]|uniref:Putative gluconeogenesis factor n=1 Tax=Tumidithrix elongata BACA0141 TaxID=2716417 RepID=A0AAW9PS16_9CYAN|nr:gluconeogenesis factor YvcK family protein [Tumidithrix elongata RA019]
MKFPKKTSRKQNKAIGWLKWLIPGLFVKRWLFLSIFGIILIVLGLAISAKLTPVLFITRLIGSVLETLAVLLPRHISGPIAVVLGIGLLWLGQKRILRSITQALVPDNDKELVDLLLTHRKLNRGPKLVALGGGTGLSTLLRGLKRYSANITAIVAVSDDGGSSGRLRREHGVLPPGDIRNCLAALADEEKLVTELFQYRFQSGEGLSGHSFGNLFLTAMSEITGDLEKAVTASSQVLAVRGRVLPATLDDMVLWAYLEDGRYIEGESKISEAHGKIKRIGCTPENPTALPQAVIDIAEADCIIIGPGSLYTSIIPNLLVPDILEAIVNRQAPCIYVCNIMSQSGETEGYNVADYVRALDNVAGVRLFDVVLVQKYPPSERSLQHYESSGCHFTEFDRDNLVKLNCPILLANVMQESATGIVRHDSDKLAGVLMRWYNRQ